VNITNQFLVIGNDAAHKVGICVVERLHKLGELLLVQLTHCAKHAFLGASRSRDVHAHHVRYTQNYTDEE
jgi:hypothetical protein